MKHLLILIGLINFRLASSAQEIFERCERKPFELSAHWRSALDSAAGQTYVQNCYNSTTYLVLYNDSTFRYKIDREGIYGYATGRWLMIKNRRIRLEARQPGRKLISVHGRNFSETYQLEDVNDMTFVMKKQKLYVKRR